MSSDGQALVARCKVFWGQNKGNLSIGRLGGCTRMVYLLKCTSSEVRLMYGNLCFFYFTIYRYLIFIVHYYPSTMKNDDFSRFTSPPKKKSVRGNCPPSFVKSCRKIGRVGASGGFFGFFHTPGGRMIRLGSRHDCGSVFPKRLGTKKYVGISPGKFGGKKPLFKWTGNNRCFQSTVKVCRLGLFLKLTTSIMLGWWYADDSTWWGVGEIFLKTSSTYSMAGNGKAPMKRHWSRVRVPFRLCRGERMGHFSVVSVLWWTQRLIGLMLWCELAVWGGAKVLHMARLSRSPVFFTQKDKRSFRRISSRRMIFPS